MLKVWLKHDWDKPKIEQCLSDIKWPQIDEYNFRNLINEIVVSFSFPIVKIMRQLTITGSFKTPT